MMLELIEAAIASHPDLNVAARIPADGKLRNALRRYRADVVIVALGQPAQELWLDSHLAKA